MVNNLTEKQQAELDLRTALALIKTLYKRNLINEVTYNNICKKYKSHL
jgi:hypothetical protein